MSSPEKYTVAVGRSCTMQGHPAPDDTCGHNHKSLEAAYRCQEKLMNWSKDRKTCSAKWYNSFICEVTTDGYRRI
jgi:hypothetical protein